MADRNKKSSKKSAPVKGGAAANPQVVATVASHKDDTAVVETAPEAEKVEGEVKADEAKTDVVKMAPIQVVGGEIETTSTGEETEKGEGVVEEIDPELEQKRNLRKEDLRLLYNDNPALVLTSPDLTEEDRVLIGEIATEQNQVVRDYSVTTERLVQEKDELERKLDQANSRLGNATALISNTVTQTVGQVDRETAAAIEGLKTTVVEVLGKNNGVKNAITTISDHVNEDVKSLKKQFADTTKSVEGKVDEIKSNVSTLAEKVDGIKLPPPPPQAPAQSSNPSSNWPWVAVIGFILTAVTIIAILLLTQDVTIKVEVQQPAAGTVNNVVPPVPSNAGVTSQQATPGGPSSLLMPTVVGATPENPCEGTTGGALGECVMTKLDLRPKDMVESDWKVVTNFFKEVIPTALEGFRACEEKYLNVPESEDFGLECQQAVKCLAAPADEAKRCWRVGAESFGQRLSSN